MDKYDRAIVVAVDMCSSWDWEGSPQFVTGMAVGIVLALTERPRELVDWDVSDSEGPLNPELRYVQHKLALGLNLATYG